MNNNIFKERFKKIIKERGLNQREISEKTGISCSAISGYLNGKYTPKQDKIVTLARLLNVPTDWLAGVEYKKDNIDGYYKFYDVGISAGYTENVEGKIEPDSYIEIPHILMGKYANSKNVIITRVNGNSMDKIIPNKSYIAIDINITKSDIKNNDIVLFMINNEYSIKRYYKDTKNNRILLRPESNDETFIPIVWSEENDTTLQLIGKVVKCFISFD